MKINLREKNGFTSVDITMALMGIILFASILASFTFSLYMSSTEAKRTATALNYAVDIFEHIGTLDFDETNASSESILAVSSIKGLKIKERMQQTILAEAGGYEIKLEFENYQTGNEIKIITLTINYLVGRNKPKEEIRLRRLKVVEADDVIEI